MEGVLDALFENVVYYLPKKSFHDQYCKKHAYWLNNVCSCRHLQYKKSVETSLYESWAIVMGGRPDNIVWSLVDDSFGHNLINVRRIHACKQICAKENSDFRAAIQKRIDLLNSSTRRSIARPHSLVRRRLGEIKDLISIVQSYIPDGHAIHVFCKDCDYRFGPKTDLKGNRRRDFRLEYYNRMRKNESELKWRNLRGNILTVNEVRPSHCDDQRNPSCGAKDP